MKAPALPEQHEDAGADSAEKRNGRRRRTRTKSRGGWNTPSAGARLTEGYDQAALSQQVQSRGQTITRVTQNLRDNVKDPKMQLRRKVWRKMERSGLVLNAPLFGRIPFFRGAEEACRRFLELPEFDNAKCIKVHPSLAAATLRVLVLHSGKRLLTPPLPGHPFLYLSLCPSSIPASDYWKAGTREGFMQLGRPLTLAEMPSVDLVVVAAVCCTRGGVRLGKGKGYGEIEYAILRDVGCIHESTPVATLCHDSQVLEEQELPPSFLQSHDLPVDLILTPSQTIRTSPSLPKPRGVEWDKVTPQMLQDIGALAELKSIQQSRG